MARLIPRTGATSRIRLDDALIVDLDVHLLENAEELAPYCDQPWRRVIEEQQPVPPFGGGGRMFPNFPGQWIPRRPVGLTAAAMREELDALSIDVGVLFPERLLGLARQPNPEYGIALARAYNRWLLDVYLTRERGFFGGIIAAPHDPEASAREIERYAGEERVVGVVLPISGTNPLWGHRKYDPIYEAAERSGLAVLYHAAGTMQMPMPPFDVRQFDTWFLNHTVSHPPAILCTVANLIGTAVPARFPSLNMVFIEAGISWVPCAMMRLDWAWEQRRGEVPLLEERPSHYMRRQMFYATQPIEEPEDLGDMAELIRLIGGEDSVLFASDYPHHDFDHPKKVFDIPLPPEAKRKIMGENALRVLNIPAAAVERVPRGPARRAG
jgi:predicted TIM-barrel fold metal-dependent hydrolase